MRLSIGLKVFATVFVTLAAVVGLLLVVVQSSMNYGFTAYIRKVELMKLERVARVLESCYAQDGDWRQLPPPGDSGDLQDWLMARLAPRAFPAGSPEGRHHRADFGPLDFAPREMVVPTPGGNRTTPDFHVRHHSFWERHGHISSPALGLLERLAVLSREGGLLSGIPEAEHSEERLPLKMGDQLVGQLALLPIDLEFNQEEEAFLGQQGSVLGWLGLTSLAVSALAATLLAGHLRRPISRLARGTRQLAAGHFSTRLPDQGGDELGQLARDFNLLAQALEGQERARREWVADTSHELRTPLAVLLAEVEALQDQVHEPDERTLALLHSEIVGMGKLVEDLHWLARGDEGLPTYSLVPVDLIELLTETADGFKTRMESAGLSLELELTSPSLSILGEPDQLRRLLLNLFENSLQYTDPGGRLRVECTSNQEGCRIRFDDTAPGVPDELLGRLCERFFRVDASRNRRRGGSGLGLSISRTIVEIHRGAMQMAASPLGGLRVDIELPCFRRRA